MFREPSELPPFSASKPPAPPPPAAQAPTLPGPHLGLQLPVLCPCRSSCLDRPQPKQVPPALPPRRNSGHPFRCGEKPSRALRVLLCLSGPTSGGEDSSLSSCRDPGSWGRGGRSPPSTLLWRLRRPGDHVARPEASQEATGIWGLGGHAEATGSACGYFLSPKAARPQRGQEPS